jgi:hypothetical protein
LHQEQILPIFYFFLNTGSDLLIDLFGATSFINKQYQDQLYTAYSSSGLQDEG